MTNIERIKLELKERIDKSGNNCILSDAETIKIALELEYLLQNNE